MNGQSGRGKVLSRRVDAWPGGVAMPAATDWRLEAELLDVGELARRAFGSPLTAGVFVQLRRGPWSPDRVRLFTEIPWLQHVREAERVVKTLLASGWAVLKCGSPEEASRLCGSVESKIVRLIRLGP